MTRPQAKGTAVLEDRLVRVMRWDFEPGAETGWHRHELDYLVVPRTDCAFLLEEPGGARRVDVAAGARIAATAASSTTSSMAGRGRCPSSKSK
jgi:hypothetical protein